MNASSLLRSSSAALALFAGACGDDPGQQRDNGKAGTGGATSGTDTEAGATDATAGACPTCDNACEEAVVLPAPVHVGGDIDYPDRPPAGGPHNGCWAAWGFHTEPVRPENWVHNLEHGGVVFLHNCPDGCSEEVERLRTFAAERTRTLVTPYAHMAGRFAAVSWGHRLVLSCLDLDAFAEFYRARFNTAPEDIGAGPPSGC